MILTLLRLFTGFLLQVLPWAFLCFYPFSSSLRLKISRFYMVLAVFISTLGVIFSGICYGLYLLLPATDILFFCCNLVFFVLLVFCVIFYFYMVRGFLAKKLFVFFFISTSALCVTSIANVIFDMFNRTAIDFLPYLGNNILINFLFTLVTWPFLFYIIKYHYMPISQIISEDVYRSLSVISSVLFIIFACGMTFVDYALSPAPENTVSASLYASAALYISLLLAVIFLYAMVFHLLQINHREMVAKNQLLQLDQQLKLNESQYCRISESIESSRKMRHDLRYHMLTLQGYLNENEIEKAKTYIEDYIHTLDQKNLHTYSENATVNYIVSHYHAAAVQQGIVFCCPAPKIPRELPIRAADLSVILGNLLENAVTAASRAEKGNRYIHLNLLYTAQMLIVTVDNSFTGEIKKEGDFYVSQKPNHMGLGIASITNIAQSYDGGIEFTHEDHVFRASVMLNLKNNG